MIKKITTIILVLSMLLSATPATLATTADPSAINIEAPESSILAAVNSDEETIMSFIGLYYGSIADSQGFQTFEWNNLGEAGQRAIARIIKSHQPYSRIEDVISVERAAAWALGNIKNELYSKDRSRIRAGIVNLVEMYGEYFDISPSKWTGMPKWKKDAYIAVFENHSDRSIKDLSDVIKKETARLYKADDMVNVFRYSDAEHVWTFINKNYKEIRSNFGFEANDWTDLGKYAQDLLVQLIVNNREILTDYESITSAGRALARQLKIVAVHIDSGNDKGLDTAVGAFVDSFGKYLNVKPAAWKDLDHWKKEAIMRIISESRESGKSKTIYQIVNDVFSEVDKWKNGHTSVIYNGNGAEGSTDAHSDIMYGSTVSLQNSTFTAPQGKRFRGWATNPEGTGNIYNEGEPFLVSSTDLELYAVWDNMDAGSYNVNFFAGGAKAIPPATVRENERLRRPETPEREGYQFGGWFYDSNFTTPYDFDTPIAKDTDLHARWDQAPAGENNQDMALDLNPLQETDQNSPRAGRQSTRVAPNRSSREDDSINQNIAPNTGNRSDRNPAPNRGTTNKRLRRIAPNSGRINRGVNQNTAQDTGRINRGVNRNIAADTDRINRGISQDTAPDTGNRTTRNTVQNRGITGNRATNNIAPDIGITNNRMSGNITPGRGIMTSRGTNRAVPNTGMANRSLNRAVPNTGMANRSLNRAVPNTGLINYNANRYIEPNTGMMNYGVNRYTEPNTGMMNYGVNRYAEPNTGMMNYGVNRYTEPNAGMMEYSVNRYAEPNTGMMDYGVNRYVEPNTGMMNYGANQYIDPNTGMVNYGANQYTEPNAGMLNYGADQYIEPNPGMVNYGENQSIDPNIGITNRGINRNTAPNRGIAGNNANFNTVPNAGITRNSVNRNAMPNRGIARNNANFNTVPNAGIARNSVNRNAMPNRGIARNNANFNTVPNAGIARNSLNRNAMPNRGIAGNNANFNTVPNAGITRNSVNRNAMPNRGIARNNANLNTVPNAGITRNSVNRNAMPNRGIAGNNANINTIPDTGITGNNANLNTVPNTGITRNNANLNNVPNTGITRNNANLNNVPNTGITRNNANLNNVPNTGITRNNANLNNVPNTGITRNNANLNTVPNTGITNNSANQNAVPNTGMTNESQNRNAAPNRGATPGSGASGLGRITRAEVAELLYILFADSNNSGSISQNRNIPGGTTTSSRDEAIMWSIGNGYLMNASGGTERLNEGLDADISRGEVAAILDRVSQAQGLTGNSVSQAQDLTGNSGQPAAFNDTQNHWANNSIARMAEYNIINSDQGSQYRPDQAATKEEVASMIGRLLLSMGNENNQNARQANALPAEHWAHDVIANITSF